MSKIEKIGQILKILEDRYEVKFQLKLLDEKQQVPDNQEKEIDDLRGNYSFLHNTSHLASLYYYKKTF